MNTTHAHLVVLGSGPGGYSAAFRAADLFAEQAVGAPHEAPKKTILVERYESIGGVCLNVGCIPSKALLHVAKHIEESNEMEKHGVVYGKPKIDINKLREWKDGIVSRLTGGLKMLSKQRKVEIVRGEGKFTGPNALEVTAPDGTKQIITFDYAIIAAGSRPVALPFIPNDDPRVMDSTGALELKDVPKSLLVMGGGIIGMEMACVYRALGSEVTVVELADGLLGGVDKDLLKPFMKYVSTRYKAIHLKTKVTAVEAKKDGLYVTFDGEYKPGKAERFDKLLSAVGRIPNGKLIDAEKAGVNVDERGFIAADSQMRTNVPHIFSIGDINGNPMLAHKAIPEGRLAAEVIAGKKHFFDVQCIPSVAYTDPEVAWVGLMEAQAKEQGYEVGVGIFPFAASGRALCEDRPEGLTKVVFDKNTHRLLGAGIVGPHAGDLIAEATLAIEMGCTAEDIALTIHPHPTLAETLAMATEIFEGTITDLYMPKK
jgi:dihydrolipoamide dehydrogenase